MCQVKVWGEKAESKLLHSLPGWLSFILHHTPAQPLQLPSYKSRGSHGSAPPKQLERKGWRRAGGRGHTCPPAPSRDACLFLPAASPTLSEQAQCRGRLCWSCSSGALAPGTHPAFQAGNSAGNAPALKANPVPAQHRCSSPQGQ